MNDILLSCIGFYNFLFLCVSWGIHQFQLIIHQIQQIDLTELSLNAFLFYCKVVSEVKSQYAYYYEHNVVVRDVSDVADYARKYLYAGFMGRRIEPYYNQWISSSILYFHSMTNTYDLVEYFVPIYRDDSIEEINALDYLTEMYNIELNQTKTENNVIVDNVFTVKMENHVFHRICDYTKKEIPTTLSTQPSSIRFISIEILIPFVSSTPFVVTLDDDAYLVDNILFSPAFVKRLMDYNVNSVTFDMNYRVNIMDNNIHSFELDSTKYLVLEKNGYTIVSKR